MTSPLGKFNPLLWVFLINTDVWNLIYTALKKVSSNYTLILKRISFFTRQPSSAVEHFPYDLYDWCTGIFSVFEMHMWEVRPCFLSLSIVASRIILVVFIMVGYWSTYIVDQWWRIIQDNTAHLKKISLLTLPHLLIS